MSAREEIMIDDHFVRFGSKSYALDKINSVEVRSGKPQGITGAVILALVAVAVAFAGPVGMVIAIVFAVLAWRQWQRRDRRQHQLFLMTSSGEAQAIESYDGDHVHAFRSAIEAAMRGQRDPSMGMRVIPPN